MPFRSFWVVVVALFAGGAVLFVSAPFDSASASGPGFNGRFVFEIDGEIYSQAANGSDLVQLTSDSGMSSRNFAPAWSPGGVRVAYLRYEQIGADFNRCELRVMASDGSQIRVLTEIEDCYSSSGVVSWGPSGEQLVFIVDGRVFVVESDGTGLRDLSALWPAHWGGANDAAWSPARDEIAVSIERSGIHLVDPNEDGLTEPRLLVEDTFIDAPNLNWSPDGRKLAYSAYGDLGDEIYWIDIESTQVERSGPPHGYEAFFNPMWAPDGSGIAFVAVGWEGERDLRLADATLTHHRLMYPLSEAAWMLDWQPVEPQPVGLVDPESGLWRLATATGAILQFYFGNPGDVPFLGDWDCDGEATPGLFRQSDAFAYLRNSNSQGIADIRFFFGNPSDVPLAGDFNGDGCDTLSIYRPSEAKFYIMNNLGENEGGLGAADYSFLFGNVGDKPVVGDWDGDGIDEIGLHRETTGFFYYRNTLTTGTADGQFFFGDAGDRFVAGDWGIVDGVETPAMFRPSNSTFYFRWTLTQGNADSEFTWPGAGMNWLPVSGDFTLD
jgi:Tol biopolymer transport system component